jgi:hypothetical protein
MKFNIRRTVFYINMLWPPEKLFQQHSLRLFSSSISLFSLVKSPTKTEYKKMWVVILNEEKTKCSCRTRHILLHVLNISSYFIIRIIPFVLDAFGINIM